MRENNENIFSETKKKEIGGKYKMKKAGIIFSLTLIMILMSFSFCFASGLELLDSNPTDGSNDARPENFLVKLYFNEDMSSEAVQDKNKEAFSFSTTKGEEMKTKLLYDSKKPNEIWVLVTQTLTSDTSYELHISGDLEDAKGSTLGADKTIALKTRNINTDNNVNMGLMGVMMVGMVAFTSISAKRQVKKQAEEEAAKPDSKVNPYKVAKETGKTVEDVVAKTNKEKEKAREKAEKKNRNRQDDGKSSIDEKSNDNDNKRVAGPKPITAAGSTFVTGRKALAEKEKEKAAARAAAGTTRPKNATGKSKNKKSH
jgi:hypothetical protein